MTDSLAAIVFSCRTLGRMDAPAAEEFTAIAERLAALAANAVVEAGEAASMPGTGGFTMACFKAVDVPVGTKIFAAPLKAADPVEVLSDGGPPCNKHPDAPHGFNRNGSHNADRYMCDCEGWQPDFAVPGVASEKAIPGQADSDRIADLEDQVEELQRAAEIVAEEYEKDCSKALRGLVGMVPGDIDWNDGLTAYEQADIVREHFHELTKASTKASPLPVLDEAMEKRALALFTEDEQQREYNPRVIRRILTAAITP